MNISGLKSSNYFVINQKSYCIGQICGFCKYFFKKASHKAIQVL